MTFIDPFGLEEELPVTGYVVSPGSTGTIIWEVLGEWDFTGLWRLGFRTGPDVFVPINLSGPGINSDLPAYLIINERNEGMPVTVDERGVWTGMRWLDIDIDQVTWTERPPIRTPTRTPAPDTPIDVPTTWPGDNPGDYLPPVTPLPPDAPIRVGLNAMSLREAGIRRARQQREDLEGWDLGDYNDIDPVWGRADMMRRRKGNKQRPSIRETPSR
jgi:hypothetical protein